MKYGRRNHEQNDSKGKRYRSDSGSDRLGPHACVHHVLLSVWVPPKPYVRSASLCYATPLYFRWVRWAWAETGTGVGPELCGLPRIYVFSETIPTYVCSVLHEYSTRVTSRNKTKDRE